jgi:hypothetical protein
LFSSSLDSKSDILKRFFTAEIALRYIDQSYNLAENSFEFISLATPPLEQWDPQYSGGIDITTMIRAAASRGAGE